MAGWGCTKEHYAVCTTSSVGVGGREGDCTTCTGPETPFGPEPGPPTLVSPSFLYWYKWYRGNEEKFLRRGRERKKSFAVLDCTVVPPVPNTTTHPNIIY